MKKRIAKITVPNPEFGQKNLVRNLLEEGKSYSVIKTEGTLQHVAGEANTLFVTSTDKALKEFGDYFV